MVKRDFTAVFPMTHRHYFCSLSLHEEKQAERARERAGSDEWRDLLLVTTSGRLALIIIAGELEPSSLYN